MKGYRQPHNIDASPAQRELITLYRDCLAQDLPLPFISAMDQAILDLRLADGLARRTQVEVAAALGVTQGTISRLEVKMRNRMAYLLQVAAANRPRQSSSS